MAKKTNLKAEKAKRNQEYALQFKKKKKRPQASRPAAAFAPEPSRVASFGGPTAHDVVCSTCGVDTTVPFKPTQGRPVLCRSCFQAA